MQRVRQRVTTPALKYGPTDLYGACEAENCPATSRATCPVCGGHFCRNHVAHSGHACDDDTDR